MKENELKLHPCYCGGEMEIKKVAQNGGMDGTYWNWELTCKKCGLTTTYAADDFYGRKYKTFEEVVDDWNRRRNSYYCWSTELEKFKKQYLLEDKRNNTKTYGDIFKEFCDKFPNVEVEDYRPAVGLYVQQLLECIPNAIVVWLKDGSKIIYISESEE